VYPGMQPRANFIAQTPFAPEKKTRRVWADDMAREVMEYARNIKDPATRKEAWEQRWDEWAKNAAFEGGKSKVSTHRRQQEHEAVLNGMFYDSQADPAKARALKE